MSMDLFDAQPHSEYQSGREPDTAQEEPQHFDGDFNDFHSVDPQSANPTYQNVEINTPVILTGFDHPSEIGIDAEQDLLESVRQQEQIVQQRLMEKAKLESQLKQERKNKGQRQLQEYFKQRELQIEELRSKNQQSQKDSQQKTKQYKTPWEKVADNIALKEGEYPGSRDVARMRQAILNKKQDG